MSKSTKKTKHHRVSSEGVKKWFCVAFTDNDYNFKTLCKSLYVLATKNDGVLIF